MGTFIYGPFAGPSNSKFRIVYEYAWGDEGTHTTLVYNVWLEVNAGNFWSSNIYCSWNNVTVSVQGGGQYNTSLYNIVGNIPYGGRHDVNLYCGYTGGSGTRYESRIQTTLYAPQKTTYTISFNANGGQGAPSPIVKQAGSMVTIPNQVPTRTGYNFMGWSEDPNATTGTYGPNAVIAYDRDMTLYAIWQFITYKLTYNGNAQNATNVPSPLTISYGATYQLSTQIPQRQGYNFLGWGNSPSGPAVYQPGQGMTRMENYTLYAIWQIITFTITYNANGGNNAPAPQTKEYGEYKQLSTQVPTRTGYQFEGWSEDPNGPVTYQPGSTFRGNYSVTFYAIWSILTYTVSYNANGGTNAPAPQTKTYGVNLTLSTQIPTRTFYKFVGWATTQNGSVAYQPGGTYTANASVTLYAVWELAANCYVRVNGVYKPGMMFVKTGGVYKKGTVSVKDGGIYKPAKS